MQFTVTNRFSGEVQFTAEIECADDAALSIKLGLAVKWAIKAHAYLAGAYLAGANLARAELAGANLAGANLAGANLARANLAYANLAHANLAHANLAGANLADAYLADAYLADANLAGADLAGAKIKDIFVLGRPDSWSAFTYLTEAGEQRVQVGCRNKTIAEGRAYWAGKDNRREVMAALDYAEAIASARGWAVKQKDAA